MARRSSCGSCQVLNLPTHALSLSESILLARELPNLGRLLHNEPVPPSTQVTADRELVRRVLAVVQGHPKLLELADAAAADPGRLADQLTAAEAGGGDAPLEAFFTRGTSELEAGQFLAVLGAWTTAALHGLPEPARELAELLSCVEDDDRLSFVVDSVWPEWWADRHAGEAPSVAEAVEALNRAAIVEAEQVKDHFVFRLHPGVVETIRGTVAHPGATLADDLLAGYWTAVYQWADERERGGEPAGRMIVHAGLSAAPYLIRLRRWPRAGYLLECVRERDHSPGTTRRLLHYLRQLRDGETDPSWRSTHEGAFASVLARVDPLAAQAILYRSLTEAREQGELDLASIVAGDLYELFRQRGDLTAALQLATEKAELSRSAGLDPWTQRLDEASRLRILLEMGRAREALDQTIALLGELRTLPTDGTERYEPWNVREVLLDIARSAAAELGDWIRSLDLSRQSVESKRQRGAPVHDVATARFNAYRPLLLLGRHDEAEQLLLGCQQVFEDAGDIQMLGMTFGARADLECERGRLDEAIVFARTALRYEYRHPQPASLAVNHHNFACYLRMARRTDEAGAHKLAAAALCRATSRARLYAPIVAALAADLRELGEASFPADVDQLTVRVEAVPGVRFGDVFAELVPDPQDRATLLAEILDAVTGSVRPAR